jgi:hypothetical protein
MSPSRATPINPPEAQENKVDAPKVAPPMIFPAMAAVAAEVSPIAKGQFNSAQKYSFRGIDDVFNSLQPILSKHGIFVVAKILTMTRGERESKSGGLMTVVTMQVAFSFTASDGSKVTTEASGEGMDSGDKATAKAMSTAMKYALLQTFQIPTAEPKDAENDNPEPAPPKRTYPTAAPKPEPKPAQGAEIINPQISEKTGNAIVAGVKALGTFDIEESVVWHGIAKEIAAKCGGLQFADLAELSELEGLVALDYLRRRYGYLDKGRKEAAARHAADGPPIEEYDK